MARYENPILVCDDEPMIIHLLSDYLQEYGYSVAPTTKGVEVLPMLRAQPIDIVFLDLRLKDIHGLDVLDQIKAAEKDLGRLIKVFVLTAVQEKEISMECMSRGAYYFFNKPIAMKAIIAQLDIAIADIARERKLFEEARLQTDDGEKIHEQVVAALACPEMPVISFAFERKAVLENAPAKAGVVTLRDEEGRPVVVQWVEDVARHLTYYIALGSEHSVECRLARRFEYVLSDDQTLEGQIFDRVVNELGAFPRCQNDAPRSSKYAGKGETVIGTETDGPITDAKLRTDDQALEDVRRLLSLSPNDKHMKTWCAFLCYTHGEYGDAVKLYCELIAEDDGCAEFHFYLGNTYYKMGKARDAVDHWQSVVKAAPESLFGKKCASRIEQAVSAMA